MILDASNLPDGHQLSAHICIVGAGAAGLSLALAMEDAGLDVLLLESGGLKAEQETQDLYQGTVADEHLHSPPDRYRQRRFGGSTTIWGGRCVPFDPIDFEARSWIPHSGWPLAYDDLLPYYGKANQLCEAGSFTYTVGEAFDAEPRAMIVGFESAHFSTDTLERFSCPTDFGRRYGAYLRGAKKVTVLLHANVTALGLNNAGSALNRATVSTLNGKTMTVRADQFVLAAGGLEVARLLLSNRDVHSNGIGNNSDVVGRYYMCHMAGTIGAIKLNHPNEVHHGYDVDMDGVYCRRRFALSTDTQRQRRIGNFVARLHHPRITDPAHKTGLLSLLYLAKGIIPYEYGKRLHGEEHLSTQAILLHLRNVICDPFGTALFLIHWLRYRTLARRKFPSIIITPRAGLYSLDFHAEQEPNPDSRVRLGTRRDALGIQQLDIDWRYTEGDVLTVQRALALLSDDLRCSEVGSFEYDMDSVEHEMTRYGAYGGHHLGTARMGTDPRNSVVDSNCRVHGIDNLFIASSAVFPTSSQANPTLTIVALALRLADHLKAVAHRHWYVPAANPEQAPRNEEAGPVPESVT